MHEVVDADSRYMRQQMQTGDTDEANADGSIIVYPKTLEQYAKSPPHRPKSAEMEDFSRNLLVLLHVQIKWRLMLCV